MMVKAVAEQRGLLHEKHGHLFHVTRMLSRETEDRQLRRLFHVAHDLHGNFYENLFDYQEVGDGIDDVEQFIEKIEGYI